MTRSRVIDRDKGFAALIRLMKSADSAAVKVGILGGDSELAEIAAANEFGTDTIPSRPAFRRAIDGGKQEIGRAAERLLGRVVDRKMPVRQALGQLGLLGVRRVQREITTLKDPPNAPRTIAQKGSSNPLIDTGRLRRAVTHEVVTGAEAAEAKRQGARDSGVRR